MNVLAAICRRAKACKAFRWLPGMRWVEDEGLRSGRLADVAAIEFFEHRLAQPYILPDVSDPATQGCLLALVREARDEPTWQPTALFHDPEPDWVIEEPTSARQTLYESYAAVLVAALEKAS